MMQYEKINLLEGKDINKSNNKKILVVNLDHISVINVMIYQ